jgi:hypothetical protein
MGIRSERITGTAIGSRLSDLSGQTVQLITWQGLTYLGKLLAMEGEVVIIRDPNAYWYNRKRHTHRIPLADLREVLIDRPANW